MMEHLIYGYAVDDQQHCKEIVDEAIEIPRDASYVWLHLSNTHPDAIEWLKKRSQLPSVVIENLLSSETRPNVLEFPSGTLLTLRAVNSVSGEDAEDFNAINIWIEDKKIITIRKHKILAIEDLANDFAIDEPPINIGEFISKLVKKMNNRIGEIVNVLEEEADAVEEKILDKDFENTRSEMSILRRRIIKLRKYLSPQRDVINRLHSDQYIWMSEETSFKLRNSAERVIRYIEEIDNIKDRILLSQEETVNKLNEDMNNTMYRLSIISALFLPLGFITGLLGVNIGGMPGVEDMKAFTYLLMGCIVFLMVGFVYFKLNKKI